jgi:hypothetical protein
MRGPSPWKGSRARWRPRPPRPGRRAGGGARPARRRPRGGPARRGKRPERGEDESGEEAFPAAQEPGRERYDEQRDQRDQERIPEVSPERLVGIQSRQGAEIALARDRAVEDRGGIREQLREPEALASLEEIVVVEDIRNGEGREREKERDHRRGDASHHLDRAGRLDEARLARPALAQVGSQSASRLGLSSLFDSARLDPSGPSIRPLQAVLFLLGAAWCALAAHEVGHLIAGRIVGFRFGFFALGPHGLSEKGAGFASDGIGSSPRGAESRSRIRSARVRSPHGSPSTRQADPSRASGWRPSAWAWPRRSRRRRSRLGSDSPLRGGSEEGRRLGRRRRADGTGRRRSPAARLDNGPALEAGGDATGPRSRGGGSEGTGGGG